MRDTITIGDKEVEMAASAATPFLFKKLFKRDFLKEAQEDQASDELYIMLAFVMASDADEVLKGNVKEEDFFAWLEEFAYLDIIDALPNIVRLYTRQKKGSSVPKKEAD